MGSRGTQGKPPGLGLVNTAQLLRWTLVDPKISWSISWSLCRFLSFRYSTTPPGLAAARNDAPAWLQRRGSADLLPAGPHPHSRIQPQPLLSRLKKRLGFVCLGTCADRVCRGADGAVAGQRDAGSGDGPPPRGAQAPAAAAFCRIPGGERTVRCWWMRFPTPTAWIAWHCLLPWYLAGGSPHTHTPTNRQPTPAGLRRPGQTEPNPTLRRANVL